MRLAPTRLVPFSYFCTCWKVRPNASPSFSWLMPSMIRRMRTRLPTYLSTGLGALVDISSTPWGKTYETALQARLYKRDLRNKTCGMRRGENDEMRRAGTVKSCPLHGEVCERFQ